MENGKSQKYSEIIGLRFGRLVVESTSQENGRTICHCICDCGNRKLVRRDHLTGGKIISCGCYQHEIAGRTNRTHGMSRNRIYRIWKSLRNRCENANIPQYSDWGGRGITVCEEWHSFEQFYEWAIRHGYSDNLSIDRKDNEGDYCPENCRWTTAKEQALNRRSNVLITHNGVTKHISEWDKDIGSSKSGRVRARLNAGWSVERAVTTPVLSLRRKEGKDNEFYSRQSV